MYKRAILAGTASAFIVSSILILWSSWRQVNWNWPLLVLGLGILFWGMRQMLFPRLLEGYRYQGLSDFLFEVHSPRAQKVRQPWGFQGLVSYFYSLTGGIVGVEGSAAELSQYGLLSTRSPSGRWFEQLRRQDASAAIAGSLGATFGAPWAAMLLPLEINIGGQPFVPMVAALTASLWVGLFKTFGWYDGIPNLAIPLPDLDFFWWYTGDFVALAKLLLFALIVIAGSLLLIWFLKISRGSFVSLVFGKRGLDFGVGATLLFLIALLYPAAHKPLHFLFEQIIGQQLTFEELGVVGFARGLAFVAMLVFFGTSGVFSAIVLFGLIAGGIATEFIGLPFGTHYLLGITLAWATLLGSPLSGAILVWELSGSNEILLPAILLGTLGNLIRKALGIQSYVHQDLTFQGLKLKFGRAEGILESITAGQAMICDYEKVYLYNTLDEVHGTLLKSKYPFLAVVNAKGEYEGLLTADVVDRAWRAHIRESDQARESELHKMVEAEDLLYRAKIQIPSVNVNQPLSVTQGMFSNTPVVPVLDDDRQVLGLLFAFNVRIVYDQQVARTALDFRFQPVVTEEVKPRE